MMGIRKASVSAVFCLLVAAALPTASCAGEPAGRNPVMEIRIGDHGDERAWVVLEQEQTFVRSVLRKVPSGEASGDWRELLEEEVHFTPSTITNYLKIWLLQRRMAHSDLQVLEHVHGSAATLYIYRVPSEDLIVVRKFMQAPDGIYMVAYHARETGIDYPRYKKWLKAIETATLVRHAGIPDAQGK